MQQFLEKAKQLWKKLKNFAFSKKGFTVALALLIYLQYRNYPQEVYSNHFLALLDQNKVKSLATLDKTMVIFKVHGQKTTFMTHFLIENIDNFNKFLLEKKVLFRNLSDYFAFIANPKVRLKLSAFAFSFQTTLLAREYLQKSSSRRKLNTSGDFNINNIFQNFIAKKETLDQLQQIVDMFQRKDTDKKPNKLKDHITSLKGVLLYGKPGTGKTLIARCLEQMPNVKFISTCASEYVEIYVGSGPKKVREVFQTARENRPAIIFIDELEAIGLQRSSSHQNYTYNVERYSALNQLLSEMDGLNNNEGILVIAATNREDLLDTALVRPGRFDSKIPVDVPDVEVRAKMFQHYLAKTGYSKEITDEDIEQLAYRSNHFSGAIIANVVNEAARASYSKRLDVIDKEELQKAFEKNLVEFTKFRQYELGK